MDVLKQFHMGKWIIIISKVISNDSYRIMFRNVETGGEIWVESKEDLPFVSHREISFSKRIDPGKYVIYADEIERLLERLLV